MEPSLLNHPPPDDHNFNKLESILPENASTQVKFYMADLFLGIRFWKSFLYIFPFNIPPWWPHPTIGYNVLNKLESTLPGYTSTQVTAFLVNWILKRFFRLFLCKSLTPFPIGGILYQHQGSWIEQTTVNKNAFTQVLAILDNWFLRRRC